jgi:hypothetical protein
MRGYLKDHFGVFEPDEVVILLAAFDRSWGAVQASGVRYPADKLEFVRAILAKHIIAAAMEGERDVGGDPALPGTYALWAVCAGRSVRNLLAHSRVFQAEPSFNDPAE